MEDARKKVQQLIDRLETEIVPFWNTEAAKVRGTLNDVKVATRDIKEVCIHATQYEIEAANRAIRDITEDIDTIRTLLHSLQTHVSSSSDTGALEAATHALETLWQEMGRTISGEEDGKGGVGRQEDDKGDVGRQLEDKGAVGRQEEDGSAVRGLEDDRSAVGGLEDVTVALERLRQDRERAFTGVWVVMDFGTDIISDSRFPSLLAEAERSLSNLVIRTSCINDIVQQICIRIWTTRCLNTRPFTQQMQHDGKGKCVGCRNEHVLDTNVHYCVRCKVCFCDSCVNEKVNGSYTCPLCTNKITPSQ